MPDSNIALRALFGSHDTVILLNLHTGRLTVLKSSYPGIPTDTPFACADFQHQFHDRQKIHPDDLYKFDSLLSLPELRAKAESKNSGTLFSFRHYKDGIYRWITLSLLVPEDYSLTSPEVLICAKYPTTNISDLTEVLEAYGRHVYKIVKCNLTTGSFRIIRQRTSEQYIHRMYIKNHILNDEWHIEEGLIHPDDLSRFKYYTDHAVILDHFSRSLQFFSCFYRRKIGSIYKWVRLSITPSTEYTEDDKIFTYIIEDVDHELYFLLEKQIHLNEKPENIFPSDISRTNISPSDLYLENLIHILPYFTQKYIDCYMIDLKKDLYIMYKINSEIISGNVPYIGTYSDFFSQYVLKSADQNTLKLLQPYGDVTYLKKILADKSSCELRLSHITDQPVKMLFAKLEEENGMPTKLICCTLTYTDEDLLKVKTFGNFDVFDRDGHILRFKKRQSKQLLAYLIDRRGFAVSPKDIVIDVLEKDPSDLNAIKYVSALARLAIKDLEAAGYTEIIIKEWNSLRINTEKLDCDYYHLIGGDTSYYQLYHNEYMKDYSWAEETNAEILHLSSC